MCVLFFAMHRSSSHLSRFIFIRFLPVAIFQDSKILAREKIKVRSERFDIGGRSPMRWITNAKRRSVAAEAARTLHAAFAAGWLWVFRLT